MSKVSLADSRRNDNTLSEANSPPDGHTHAGPERKGVEGSSPFIDDAAILTEPSREDLVEGLIGYGEVGVLFGDTQAFKSFLVLDLAFHVGIGKSWQGRKVKRGSVLYVAGEGWSGMKQRVAAWKQRHNVSGKVGVYFHPAPVNVLAPNEVGYIIGELSKLPELPVFTIVETVSTCLSEGNENSPDMQLVTSFLRRISEVTKGTVLAIHHNKRGTKRERGHDSLRKDVDFCIYQQRNNPNDKRAKSGKITLRCIKARNCQHFDDIHLGWEEVELDEVDENAKCITSCVITPLKEEQPTERVRMETEKNEAKLSERIKLALDILTAHPEGLTYNEWRLRWQEVTRASQSTFDRLLREMKQSQSVSLIDGRYVNKL